MRPKAITEIQPLKCGVVESIQLEPSEASRLMRLGVAPERRIRVLQIGPQVVLETAGTRIALDRALADRIYVRSEPPCNN